jgi:hypothetical protein
MDRASDVRCRSAISRRPDVSVLAERLSVYLRREPEATVRDCALVQHVSVEDTFEALDMLGIALEQQARSIGGAA